MTADPDILRDKAEVYGQTQRLAGASIATLRAVGQVHRLRSMSEAALLARVMAPRAGTKRHHLGGGRPDGDALRRER